MGHGFALWVLSASVLATVVLGGAPAAGAAAPQTCSGTPGVLAGTYSSNVFVKGECVVGAPTTVKGNVILLPGSALIASVDFTTTGNVEVRSGATLVGGQESDAEG